jgi:hypothetical protein
MNGMEWPTLMAPMHSAGTLAKPGGSGSLLVMSATEVSSVESPPNPNSLCGMQAAPMLVQTLVPNYGYLTTITEQMPASGGQGHLVMNTDTQTSLANLPSQISTTLYVGTNTGATKFFTGRYPYPPLQKTYDIGDSVLAAVVDQGAAPSVKPLKCARNSQGLLCDLTNGSTYLFTLLSDANGWNAPQYGSTIELGDVNGDGALDVCARASAGYMCWLWNGSAFSTFVQGPAFTDAGGWYLEQYYATIHLGDIDGDFKADVCARSSSGITCWLSNGTSFGAAVTGPALSDSNGWYLPVYYNTIRYVDHNGDGRADVCARWSGGNSGCWLSNGTSFSAGPVGPY